MISFALFQTKRVGALVSLLAIVVLAIADSIDSDTEISTVAGYLASLKRAIDGGRFSLISIDEG